jgi:hypothetical protein
MRQLQIPPRPEAEFEQMVADSVGGPFPLFGQSLFAQAPSHISHSAFLGTVAAGVVDYDDSLRRSGLRAGLWPFGNKRRRKGRVPGMPRDTPCETAPNTIGLGALFCLMIANPECAGVLQKLSLCLPENC